MKTKEIEEELIGMKIIHKGVLNRTVGYLRGSKIEYKMLLDSEGRINRLCRILGMSVYYLLGPDGEVRWSKGAFPPISAS